MPYDGSTYSKRALNEAKVFAKINDSEISLLNVVNESIYREHSFLLSSHFHPMKKISKDYTKNIIEHTRNLLKKVCFDIEKNHINIRPHVITGDPKKATLDYSKLNKIDLIIMRSQGL